MKKKIYIILTYLVVFLNSNSLSDNSNNKLKIGLLVPFSGEYQELGNSFLFSIQLALEEIGDKNILIIPRDSGSNDPKKLIQGIKEISAEGAKIIIGPINFDEIEDANWYSKEDIKDLTSKKKLKLPSKISIAYKLINEWIKE